MPNSQYISPVQVQYINRSQVLITDLQPAKDDTCHRVCTAMLMNPFASSPRAFHQSLPTCHLTPFPVIPQSIPLIVHLFFSIFARCSPHLSSQSFFPDFLARITLSQTQQRGFSTYYGLVYTHDSFKHVGSSASGLQ